MTPPILGIWASSFAQPTGDYQAIMTATVDSGGASSITFSSIPSTYKHLQIRGIHRSSISSAGNNIGMYMRFNGDTGSNYYWHELAGNGASSMAYGQSDTGINASPHGPRSGDTASSFNADIIDILDYTNTSKNKVSRALVGDDLNGSGWIHLASGLWNNTAAITSITFFLESSDFVEHSQLALYGIKGA